MKFLEKAIISFLCILPFSGCRENHNSENKSMLKLDSPRLNEKFRILESDRHLDYKLPDTIALKDTLKGYIVYRSHFDSISIRPESRYIVDLYLAKTDSISKNFAAFQKKEHASFARIHDSLLLIYGITFERRGNHWLEGYIKDYIFDDVEGDSVNYRSIENHILFEVYVK